MIYLFQMLFLNFQISTNHWITIESYLNKVKKFSKDDCDGFVIMDGQIQKQPEYIDCTNTESYIFINNTQNEVQYYQKFYSGTYFSYFITYDLILFKTWNDNDQIYYSIGSSTSSFIYQSTQVSQQVNNFCGNQQAVLTTLNYTINNTHIEGYHKFSAQTTQGIVAIKNLIIEGLRCHPTCKKCYGSFYNQCQECFIGSPSNENTCSQDCSDQRYPYFVNYYGCRQKCPIDQALYWNRSCVSYPVTYFVYVNINTNPNSQQYRWSQINSFDNVQSLRAFLFETYYIYGIFKYTQGYQSFVKLNNLQYLIGIKLEIILFNEMPSGSRISLQINQTYKAHVYNDGNGLKFDQFIFHHHGRKANLMDSDINYYQNDYYSLYFYTNVSSDFIISLVGNYQTNNAGWGIRSIQITSGQCPSNCKECQSQFKCSKCNNGYFISKFGVCTTCQSIYQYRINDTHCQDFDDETLYSKYIVKEFVDLSLNPEAYQQYQMLDSQGQNFLKGKDVYYSIWKEKYRIFGGPLIWSKAKFQRIYDINSPHHSISISFIIIFGPKFADSGYFVFTLDSQIQYQATTANVEIEYQQHYLHNGNTLTVEWECQSDYDDPINSYCGFYQYYLAVHYCQPGCTQCTNWNECQVSLNNPNCGEGQFLDIHTNECIQCTPQCKICTSLQNCLECIDGFTDPFIGCICGMSKFQNSNTCQDCQKDCLQCINKSICLECNESKFKVLINNDCKCQFGYYSDNNNDCQQCLLGCKNCQNSQNCDNCFDGYTLDQFNNCSLNHELYYSTALYKALQCPQNSSGCNPCSNNFIGCTCGDMIIFDQEECDDGNSIEYDGCFQCKFSCQKECTKCIEGKCFECATSGWYLEVNGQTNICREQCYDGITAGKEQCDDAIDSSNCKDCKFFCRPDCQTCNFTNGVCTKCREGLNYTKNYCQNNCGDSILVSAPDIDFQEQCDDGNQIEFDGCDKQCQFQCQKENICKVCLKNKCYYCQHGYQLNWMMNKCECDSSCLQCDFQNGKGCIRCQNGYELRNKICQPICGDSIITNHEQCDDGNMNIEDGCHQCQYTCEFGCNFCLFGDCILCQNGYELRYNRCYLQNPIQLLQIKQKEDLTHPLQSSQYLLENINQYRDFYFEDFIKNHFQDIAFILQLQLFNFITLYVPNASINKLEEQTNICPINCLSCFNGQCLSCSIGYQLDIINNLCNSICGDHFITIEESCDDGNNILQDGCFECKFQCQDQCTNCYYGKCKSCLQTYYFDANKQRCVDRKICIEQQGYYYNELQNICQSKCGDNIKAGKEQCDDGNDIPFDGCYQCQFQCEQLCSICNQGQCVNCQIGYKLQNSICVNDCGDGLLFASEQCDDANLIPRDGCTNCLIDPGFKCITQNNKSYCYNCQSNCVSCDYISNQITCLQCQKGFFLLSNECIKCSEQCEDCVQTPNNCTLCKIDNCERCDNKQGFYNDFNLRKCVTKCGDFITAGQEQCDDGNLLNYDGCNSFCEQEKGFKCTNSICQKIQQKYVELEYSNSTTTNSMILKSEVNLETICPQSKIIIEHFEAHQFNYTLNPFVFNSTETLIYGCQIQLEFFKTITEIDLIHFTIPFNSNQSRLVEEYTVTIIPRKQIYYSSEQKQQAQTVASTSNKLMFLLQLIGPLTMFLGGLTFFWTILEILTWINNFYYFNIEYPINVKIFFQQFKWDDIFYIPDFISLNQPNDPYYFEAPIKFKEKNVNPLFINNIQLFIFLISIAIIAFFGYLKSNQIPINQRAIKFLCSQNVINKQNKFKLKINRINHYSQKQKNFLQFIFMSLKLLQIIIKIKNLLELYQYNIWSKIISIIQLLLLDVFMGCIIQLYCPKINQYNYIIFINDILAVVSLVFILIIYFLYNYVISKHSLLLNHPLFKRKYFSIYEVIDYKNKTAKLYCQFNLIRKFAFILSIVLLYNKPILQTAICCLSCFMNLAFLIYQNPFNSKSVMIQTTIPDICIFCNALLALLIALDDNCLKLDSQQTQLVGWLIIFFISVSIAIQILFLLIEFIQRLKQNCKNLIMCICKIKTS